MLDTDDDCDSFPHIVSREFVDILEEIATLLVPIEGTGEGTTKSREV